MQYINFIRQPNIHTIPGIVVDKDTEISFEREGLKQTIKDLRLHSELILSGENYDGRTEATVYLNEGDVLLFDNERGYLKPTERFVTVEDAIKELECVLETMKE